MNHVRRRLPSSINNVSNMRLEGADGDTSTSTSKYSPRKGVGGANSDEGTETLVLCILIPSLWVRPRSCGLPEGVGSCLAGSCAGQLLLQALHLHDPPKARVVAQVQPRTHTWPSY
jgi:hypothetical protein